MKKLITNNYEKYFTSYYTSIHDDEIQNIRNNYKVIDVDWLDNTQINSKIMNDEYFEKSPKKKRVNK
jgi:chromosomal replication initiation ATPase DnaA